jgi:hypothetical protein
VRPVRICQNRRKRERVCGFHSGWSDFSPIMVNEYELAFLNADLADAYSNKNWQWRPLKFTVANLTEWCE